MSQKRFLQHILSGFLLLHFGLLAVCGPGLHLLFPCYCDVYDSRSVSPCDHSHEGHPRIPQENHSLPRPASDADDCSICSFYHTLQQTVWMPVLLQDAAWTGERCPVTETQTPYFIVAVCPPVRGPPILL
ncbi:MAG: hypothetical protein LBQ54_08445 [Planctomycetaceae bacterium]|nr:hypothetical protein [Planctomycetaceae bacterium]